jgi:GTPase SAR1 family protein
MQRQITLVLNGKGGVGKSFFAVNFVQYLIDQQVPHIAFDTDNENSTLKRFHPQASYIHIENIREIDGLFTALEKSNLVVADCRAASTDLFLHYFAEVDLIQLLKLLNARLTIVAPVNHEADSVEQVKIISGTLRGHAQYAIVRNESHSKEFNIYDRSKTRQRVINEFGGREISMPRLYDWLVAQINETNLPITKAMGSPEFSLNDRQRLKNWQQALYRQIENAQDLLLPAKGSFRPATPPNTSLSSSETC